MNQLRNACVESIDCESAFTGYKLSIKRSADLTQGFKTCRFPIGGDTMSVTSGVVSRIEVTSYSHGATALLGMQIDAGSTATLSINVNQIKL